MAKLPPEEEDRRYRLIEEMLAACVPRHQVYEACREEFGIKKRQAQRLVGRVYERWVREGKERNREDERERIYRTFETIISGAITDRRWSAATRAAREMAKFMGIHAGELIRHEGMVLHAHAHQIRDDREPIERVPIEQLTPAEKRRELARLEAKRKAVGGHSGGKRPPKRAIIDARATER